MQGDRSSLVLEAIRLINECRPSVFIWENVKGTFSSNNGADFWAIIQAFANIGGYRLEWQLLNTSWVLPQNRERVYLVGYSTTPAGDWRGVFPIGENVRENTAKRPVGYEIGDFRNDEGWRPRKDGLAPCLATRRHSETDVSNTPPLLKDVGTFRTDAGWQSSKDGNTPTLLARARDSYCSSQTLLKVKSATSKGYEVATEGDSINLSQPNSETRRGRVGKGKAQTLDTSCNQAVLEPIIGAIRGRNPENPNDNSKGIEYKQRFEYNKKGTSNALTSDVTMNMVVEPNYRIRRLTPIECERLQGFPDNHTEYGNYDGEVKKMSNTQRYKQCGNAVTVDIVALVAEAVKPLFK